MSVDTLFRPFTIKGLTLPNRIVMAPMTRSFSPGGIPTSDVAAYYRRRAEGEVGLIITEGTVVERPAARNDANVPVFHGDALPEWKTVVDEVHAAGGLIAPQIWHVGAARGQGAEWQPLGQVDSPSGLIAPGKRVRDVLADGGDWIEVLGVKKHIHGYLKEFLFDPSLTEPRASWASTPPRSTRPTAI